ncbi:MAG: hypothetical protein HRF43_06855 [Phycisphaerae bacterium]|jgi:hypothetical protein
MEGRAAGFPRCLASLILAAGPRGFNATDEAIESEGLVMPTSTPTPSFWTRLFGRRSRDGDPPFAPGFTEPMPTPNATDSADAAAEPAERSAGPLARWSRRDQAIEKLQEGYERVNRVIEEIQKHLVQQGERSERICCALDKIAQAMADGPQVARQQALTLERIAGQIESSNARTQQLAEIVSELPKTARTQTDTLVGISRQLEVSNEQRLVTSQTMDRLGTSLQTLGETSLTQSEILRQMNQKAAEQSRQLAELIAEQGRRFQMLFVATVIVAVAAVGAAVAGILLRP